MRKHAWQGVVGLGMVLGLGAAGAAENEVGRPYLEPQIGGVWTDKDRTAGHREEDWLFGVSIGRHLTERWSLEFNADKADLDTFKLYGASVDALRVFRRSQPVSPYLSFGMGALRHDPDIGDHSTDLMAQIGAGLLWQVAENSAQTLAFSLRPEIKVRADDAGAPGHFLDYIARVGFHFSFGAPRRPAPAPMPAPVVEPAPQPQPAPEPQPQPAPEPAVPADSDGDGVPDTIDRCPGTPRGVAVDEFGCPKKGSITLTGVNFEVNSATLTADSHAALDRLAEDLKKYPNLRIELQGHTDSTGSDSYNMDLSQRRAESVRDYLIARGVSASQVTARGYGETEPIASNATAEGRAQNRRVVMKVLSNPGDVEVKGEGTTE